MDKGAVPNSRRSGAVVLAPITAIRIPIITDLDTDLNDAIATASDVTGVGIEIAIDPIAVIARFSSLEQAVTASSPQAGPSSTRFAPSTVLAARERLSSMTWPSRMGNAGCSWNTALASGAQRRCRHEGPIVAGSG